MEELDYDACVEAVKQAMRDKEEVEAKMQAAQQKVHWSLVEATRKYCKDNNLPYSSRVYCNIENQAQKELVEEIEREFAK